MTKEVHRTNPATADTSAFGMRKTTFCFLVACLFGNSSSLSSQPHNRMPPKAFEESLMQGGTKEAISKNPTRSKITRLSSSRINGSNGTDSGSILDFRREQEAVGLRESKYSNEREAVPISLPLPSSTLIESFKEVRNDVIDQLRQNDNLDDAKMIISGMIEYLKDHSIDQKGKCVDEISKVGTNTTTSFGQNGDSFNQEQCEEQILSDEERRQISEMIDEAFQAFFARAFAPIPLNYGNINRSKAQKRNAWHRVALGVELLKLQLGSSDVLVAPYHHLPKRVVVQALAAVTRLQERRERGYQQNHSYMTKESETIHPDTAFRLLQRLATGVGVRNSHRSKYFANKKRKKSIGDNYSSGSGSIKPAPLFEVDFNRVLNIYSSTGKMEMAHRVIALQERTPHAPALSPVTYSILVKGYGKLCDAENIDALLRHAASTEEGQNFMKPDTIFFNSLMDAYINCRQLHKAQTILTAMILNDKFIYGATDRSFSENDLNSRRNDFFTFPCSVCPSPNLRSYNILLKGYAKEGLLPEALKLAEEMRSIGSRTNNDKKWWDHVTTNTLVQTAVVAKEFGIAQDILDQYALSRRKTHQDRNLDHPNADAYTTLMDGYAKDGKLKQAISLLKTMRERKVEPNEYHYSCLIGSLAREGKADQAEKMLDYVKTKASISRRHLRVIHNAYISGLVEHHGRASLNDVDDEYDKNVNKALLTLRAMIDDRIMPDANTVAIILDGFGHCLKPRMKEAVTLVEKLETQGIIPKNHIRVTTALVRVCGSCESLEGAIACFRRIKRPDVAAINALIDAAVRSGNDKVAVQTFNRYFNGDAPCAIPNVISFSTMIGAHMKKGTFDGSIAARKLYQEMRFQRRILPDRGLVDIIVKGMVETSRTCGVQASDARFAAGVLRDAEMLDWEEGQLEKRKRAIESAMNNHVANAWEEEAELYGLWKKDGASRRLSDNNMFERHGWNEVDSGFRLWGPGKKETERTTDDFLESKGWNDMDSGFRLFF
mmetsp:Transcript_13723/g.38636  ORF Transcript_13723/g.38636 Transcript_13723/m.38636 type:complete len:1002 (-) Transcript_13723:66-3071(-)